MAPQWELYNEAVNANTILQTQRKIKSGDHITITGKVQCNGDKCDTDLILRASLLLQLQMKLTIRYQKRLLSLALAQVFLLPRKLPIKRRS